MRAEVLHGDQIQLAEIRNTQRTVADNNVVAYAMLEPRTKFFTYLNKLHRTHL